MQTFLATRASENKSTSLLGWKVEIQIEDKNIPASKLSKNETKQLFQQISNQRVTGLYSNIYISYNYFNILYTHPNQFCNCCKRLAQDEISPFNRLNGDWMVAEWWHVKVDFYRFFHHSVIFQSTEWKAQWSCSHSHF